MNAPASRDRIAAGRAWWAQSLAGHGMRRMRELDLDTHALALGAQQLLCTAPLIVAISAVVQRGPGHGIGYAMTKFFGLSGFSADAVVRLFGRSSSSISTPALVLSVITAVVFTTGVAAVQQHAFELIWTLPRRKGPRTYLRQLIWAPTLAMFTIAVLVATRGGRWIDDHVPGLGGWGGRNVCAD